MTNNDPRERKRHNRRVHLSHAVGLTLVVMVSLLFFQLLRGYALDIDTGKVVVNGLVLVDSQPEGAKIFVDEEQQGDTTSSKITMVEGLHNLRLEKEGFDAWERQIEVEASGVVSLENIRLVRSSRQWRPIDVDESRIESVKPIDSKNLLVMFDDNNIGLVDLSAAEPEVTSQEPLLELDEDDALSFDGFAVVDTLGQFLLMRMNPVVETDGGIVSYRIYDAGRQRFDGGFETAEPVTPNFFSNSNRVIYVNSQKDLVVVDIDQATAQKVASDVLEYSTSVNTIAASITTQAPGPDTGEQQEKPPVTTEPKSLITITNQDNAWTKKKFINLDSGDSGAMAMVQNNQGNYLVVENGGYTMVYNLDDNQNNDLPPEPVFITSISALSIEVAPSGVFVMIQGTERSTIVDLRQEDLVEIASDNQPGQIYWIDGFHMAQSAPGSSILSDYDRNYQFTFTGQSGEASRVFVDSDWTNFGRVVTDDEGVISLEVFGNK